MRSAIILNRHAGSFHKAEQLLNQVARMPEVMLLESRDKRELPVLVRQAIDQGAEALIAAGGDGSVNDVVNAMCDSLGQLKFGVIPLGTGNDFARSINMPADPLKAFETICSGHEERVDLIRITTRKKRTLCVNLASGGIGGRIEEVLDKKMKERWGKLSYVRGAAKAILKPLHFQVELELDGTMLGPMRVLNIIIGNGRAAGGGFEVAPHARPTDGLMDIVIVHEGSKADLAGAAARLISTPLGNDYTQSPCVSNFRARQVRIHSRPRMSFSVDGTLFSRTPIAFELLPGALRVLTGAMEKGERDAA